MKISDTPVAFFKINLYFTNPSLFMEKIGNPLFSEILKTQTLLPLLVPSSMDQYLQKISKVFLEI